LRDTHYPLRRAINTVLSGNITYNGQPVKLYDEKRKVADTDNVYIIFSTQQTAISQPIDESWITDELITL
jgi:hypothetical protein